jgi:acetyltransferase
MTDTRAQAIGRLLSPRSVAVLGASADFSKINGRPLKHLLDKGYQGRILPVNPKYPRIGHLPCYPDAAALPEAPDMTVVAVPAADVLASIEALGQRGAKAAVVFSSGFGEMGADGAALERAVVAAARRHGMVLLGPNCLGFVNAFDHVYATFSQYADGDTGAGPIAFVTQSGAFGTAIAALARQRGLGLGYFINTGNQADLGFSELMLAVIDDPRIRVAAGYLEGLDDGAALVRLAERCRALGKPLVLTKVGRLAAGQRAAASHTGALAVGDAVFDAVIRQHGVLRARNEEQMLDMLEVLAQPRRVQAAGPSRGRGLGIATQSGGAGVMMADRAEELGLAVPSLSVATRERMGKVMPAFGAVGNPVDVTGQFVARPELLRESVVALLDDPAIDLAVVWLQLMTAHVDTLVAIFCEIRDRSRKPFVVCWVAAPPEALLRLRAEGIVVYGAGERAVEALAALTRLGGPAAPAAAGPLPVPPSALAGTDFQPGVQPSVTATAWLREAGLPMAPVALAGSEDEAVALWRALGRAVALKIESPDITHKTEIGGVLLGLDDEAALRAGWRRLHERVARHAPKARIDGVLVQPMAEGHLELVVGVQRDPGFGMVVMVGLGGVLVEVLKDVAFRQAPFDVDEGLAMLAELRGAALLDGVRGQPPVDRMALARLLADLSRWAAAMQPWLAELDLNPVRVGPAGPVAVDCVMLLRPLSPLAVGMPDPAVPVRPMLSNQTGA